MKNGTPIRVGIAGCGYQGGILAQSIARGEALQVTACADPDRAAAARVAAIGRATEVFTSAEEMLERAAVDAVLVATSHQALAPSALAAITAGKHVLCEKPIGMGEKEAARLEEAVEQARVCFMAGYSFRYAAGLQLVHDLLHAGAVGEVKAVTGSIGTGPMMAGWQARLETGGGPDPVPAGSSGTGRRDPGRRGVLQPPRYRRSPGQHQPARQWLPPLHGGGDKHRAGRQPSCTLAVGT